jgi:DNA-nicking Smr family endonuclease
MTRPRRPRTLTSEERRLWAEVARSVSPLCGRALPDEPEPEPRPAAADPVSPAPRPEPPRPAQRRSGPPPLAPVERRTLLALRRGARRTDAVIDLHGMRQAEAHDALIGFLRRAQARGHTLVLVVTGKGAADAGGFFAEERGVLRRVVPHWLRLPELRPLVLGFEEAAAHHGGAGALYVRLRRRRVPGEQA